jgi:hypothetical protein
MRRTLPLSSIAVGIVLALLAGGAGAAPGPFGSLQKSAQSSAGQITLARHGGPMMGMHMHSAGPRIAAPHFNRGPMLHARNFAHVHHRHHRFFFAAVPYYDYSDDDSNCWWSRRYHHWVCPSYY